MEQWRRSLLNAFDLYGLEKLTTKAFSCDVSDIINPKGIGKSEVITFLINWAIDRFQLVDLLRAATELLPELEDLRKTLADLNQTVYYRSIPSTGYVIENSQYQDLLELLYPVATDKQGFSLLTKSYDNARNKYELDWAGSVPEMIRQLTKCGATSTTSTRLILDFVRLLQETIPEPTIQSGLEQWLQASRLQTLSTLLPSAQRKQLFSLCETVQVADDFNWFQIYYPCLPDVSHVCNSNVPTDLIYDLCERPPQSNHRWSPLLEFVERLRPACRGRETTRGVGCLGGCHCPARSSRI